MNKLVTLLVAALMLSTPAFAKKKAATKEKDHHAATAEKKLYDRLGGKKAITAVVDQFVTNCATDDRIKSFFADTAKDPARLAKFKKNLIDQICSATGGPCTYTGKNMKDAHAGMGVKDEHFSALVEDLGKALDTFNVPAKEKGELVSALAPMKGDIVTPGT